MNNPEHDQNQDEQDPELYEVVSSEDFNTEITVEEKAASHVWHYAQLQSEIDTHQRVMDAEIKRSEKHHGRIIEALQRQQHFWANPVKMWWERHIEDNPKAKKSFSFSSGTIKLIKGREVVEIKDGAKAENYIPSEFVSTKTITTHSFDKKKIKEHIKTTGEVLEFAEIVKKDDKFEIETIKPAGEEE